MSRFASMLGLMLCVVGAGPLDQLDRLAGTWNMQGAFLTTPYSTAGPATATTTCAWSSDRLFMICQQHVTRSGKTDGDVTNQLGVAGAVAGLCRLGAPLRPQARGFPRHHRRHGDGCAAGYPRA